jgi:restriction endonuclease S subunit
VENLLIPVPPPEEQASIAAALEVVESKLAREEFHRQSLERMYASLLHDLMTGAKRLPEFTNGS